MRLLWALLGAAGLAGAFWPPQSQSRILILSGDTNGNLAPCGCTKPMTGGIKRRVSAAQALGSKGRTTLLENGGLVSGNGRQDELKAEAMAEILGKAGWDAINVGPSEAKLGKGELMALQSLSQGKLLASVQNASPLNDPDVKVQSAKVSGPFLVLGLTARPLSPSVAPEIHQNWLRAALSEGTAQAKEAGLAPILLLQGDLADARAIAKRFPSLALIQYRSGGDAGERPLREGNTLLVTPGADGKHLLRLVFSGGQFRDYRVISLGPEFADDPTAARIYRSYLSRVSGENLLGVLPRFSTAMFAGNERCGACHKAPAHVWRDSLHARALDTLEKRGHGRDPDCLPCHVVGLESSNGFKSRLSTPQMVGVGCESCHGPGREHSTAPTQVQMPNVSAAACAKCHTANTSPGFKFSTYWERVRH